MNLPELAARKVHIAIPKDRTPLKSVTINGAVWEIEAEIEKANTYGDPYIVYTCTEAARDAND